MSKQRHMRADELLVNRGLASDLHEATALIMADKVRTGKDDSIRVDKSGMQLAKDAQLSVKTTKKYVSRGGYKLEGALDDFDIDVAGLRCVDLGASTGGFTDCLLQRGAESVCAIDVGYGQLAHSLQTDSRVEVRDRVNIRTAEPEGLGAPFDLVVADLSFVGISTVAKNIVQYVSKEGLCVLLVKPQFEARREEVGERGIISDPAVHERIIERTVAALSDAGLCTNATTASSIKGAIGNTEFWLLCSNL